MRAIIRVTVENITDEKLIELRKKIEELVKVYPGARIDVSMMML